MTDVVSARTGRKGKEKLDRGARPIVRSFDLFGRHSPISIWVLREYHDANQKAMERSTPTSSGRRS